MGNNQSGRHAYSDLHKAIADEALIQKKDGAIIIGNESTGVQDEWIFDLRAIMLQPAQLNRYAEIFWDTFASRLPFQVGGVETAGIPLVAAIVMKSVERGTPVNGFYIRKSRKRQGLMKNIEGKITDDPVILVDDLLNSGQSMNKQIKILNQIGKKTTNIFSIISCRDANAYEFLRENQVALTTLFTIADFGVALNPTRATEIPADSYDISWVYRAPTPSLHVVVQKSGPVLGDGMVFFGGDDGVMRALDQQSGSLRWEFKIRHFRSGKGILSTPAFFDHSVFFGGYDGTVYALDARTGTKKWSYSAADWIGSSPCASPQQSMLYVGLEFGLKGKRGGIAALDLSSGVERWVAYHSGLTHGSPLSIPEESLIAIGSNDGVLYAYDAKTGVLRWKFPTGGEIKSRPSYDPLTRTIIFGCMDGTVYSLKAMTGEPYFARELGGGIYSIPLVLADTVYVSSLDKNLYALDCTTGATRWKFETRGRIFASPTLIDGTLWIGSNDGCLYRIDPLDGNLLDFFQATERIVNQIVGNKKIYFVPTSANEIYCITPTSNS